MYRGPDSHLPADLQNLTGVGKEKLLALRSRVQVGLIHSDDERGYSPHWHITLTNLNSLAQRVLGSKTDDKESGRY